jgi:DNA-binding transcriptional ArsR family regulator
MWAMPCDTPAITPSGTRSPADLVFAALGDATRRALIAQLTDQREVRVTDLAARFDMTRPAISQHLRVLREAGLVQETRRGRERLHRLHPAGFQLLSAWLHRYDHF